MSFIAYQKFWRLAGIDHTHVNGLSNKFCEADDSVIAPARACLTPMFPPPYAGCEIMPVFSSGQTARQAADTYRELGSTDLIFAAEAASWDIRWGLPPVCAACSKRGRRRSEVFRLWSSLPIILNFARRWKNSLESRARATALLLLRRRFHGVHGCAGAARHQWCVQRALPRYADSRAVSAVHALPGDWVRRRCAIAHAGVDVGPSACNLHPHARAGA